MPTKKPSGIKVNVTGMSIQDIMGMSMDDVMKLSGSELKKLTSRLASAANKRLRRMEKAGVKSPAYTAAVNATGAAQVDLSNVQPRFSVADKNLNQLRREFMSAKRFLQAKTGTVAKAKEFQKRFETKTSVKLTDEQQGEFWKLIHRLQTQEHHFMSFTNQCLLIEEFVAQSVKKGLDINQIMKGAVDEIERVYEEEKVTEDWTDITEEEEFFWG